MTHRIDEVAEQSAARTVEHHRATPHPHGSPASSLLTYNHKWAAAVRVKNPHYFEQLAEGQTPDFFYLGCCDSRVVPSEMLGLLEGEVFVYRSVAGLVSQTDASLMAALQYAVHHLHVKSVLVTGHHRCGGIAAAYAGQVLGVGDEYLAVANQLRVEYKEKIEAAIPGSVERLDAFAELSVIFQCQNVAKSKVMQLCWEEERREKKEGGVEVLGWVFALPTGYMHPLLRLDRHSDIAAEVSAAVQRVFEKYHSTK